MPDTITGVLVLQKMTSPDVWRLFFEYTRHDGKIGYSSIPMLEGNTPRPAGYQGPLWQFARDNPRLHCSPSVRMLGPKPDSPDHFHNNGQWVNDYVQMAHNFGAEPDEDFEGTMLVRKINELKDKPSRDEFIFELRRKGVLL